MDPLLAEIEAFLAVHRMPSWRFGMEAMRDKHFVEELRGGRRCWPETQAKVRLFMATYNANGGKEAA